MTLPLPSAALIFGPVVTAACVVIVVLLAVNLRSVRRPRARVWGDQAPLVSVLVPARNEAATIEACLAGIAAQNYPNLEVVVVDDNSDDGTAAIVRGIADSRIRLVAGAPLPDGWTGKNWACEQLWRHARGEVLCFVDADTVLAPDAVGASLGTLTSHDVGLLTLLLATRPTTIRGGVLLPMVNHAMLALFPAWAMNRRVASTTALAMGPFMMVQRSAYEAVGGHAANRAEVADDVALCRSVKAAGLGVRLANGTDLVATPWYRSVHDTWRGFTKNAVGALDHSGALSVLAVVAAVIVLCAPFLRLGSGLLGGSIPTEVTVQVSLLLGARVVTSVAGRDPLWSVPTHPIGVAFWAAALSWSTVLGLAGRSVEWRGRGVAVRPSD